MSAGSQRCPGLAVVCTPEGTIIDVLCDSASDGAPDGASPRTQYGAPSGTQYDTPSDIQNGAPSGAQNCEVPGAVAAGESGTIGKGQPLSLLFDRGSLGKSVRFMSEIRAKGSAFGWELVVHLHGSVFPMYFSGGRAGDLILIAGAKTNSGIVGLYEDLLRMNNEQSAELRMAMKGQYEILRAADAKDFGTFNQVMRLNNELVSTQRELAKANFELVKANAELKRLDEQKNRFLGMASHDLRSPLGAILNFSEFLIDEAAPTLSEEHRKFLDIIRDSSDFMLRLVNDLLDVATIESGELNLDLARIDPAEVVRNSVTMYRALAVRKNISIRLDEEKTPLIAADATRIGQAIGNLIGNAIKFSAPGSVVEVAVGMASAPENSVMVTVLDHGPGIPEAEKCKLFSMFGRTTVRSAAGEKNTGLGLAIAKRIVEGHGGTISLESEVGSGTIVRFTLTARGPAAGSPTGESSEGSTSGSGGRPCAGSPDGPGGSAE